MVGALVSLIPIYNRDCYHINDIQINGLLNGPIEPIMQKKPNFISNIKFIFNCFDEIANNCNIVTLSYIPLLLVSIPTIISNRYKNYEIELKKYKNEMEIYKKHKKQYTEFIESGNVDKIYNIFRENKNNGLVDKKVINEYLPLFMRC